MIKTLWIGRLQGWMDEDYLDECFAYTDLSVKIIRNNQTGLSEGYPFKYFRMIKTLWIGRLQGWMDEDYLDECFAYTDLSVKIIRNNQTGNNQTGLSEGYGFLEFESPAAAEMALRSYNGEPMLRAEQVYTLNWAAELGKV